MVLSPLRGEIASSILLQTEIVVKQSYLGEDPLMISVIQPSVKFGLRRDCKSEVSSRYMQAIQSRLVVVMKWYVHLPTRFKKSLSPVFPWSWNASYDVA